MNGVTSPPAAAAIAEPMTQDSAVTRSTLMPHNRAPRGSSDTARIEAPNVVRCNRYAVATEIARAAMCSGGLLEAKRAPAAGDVELGVPPAQRGQRRHPVE